MEKRHFTRISIADLLQWQTAAIREAPDTPTQKACEMAPSVSSYTTVVRGVQTLIVAKLDNGQTVVWHMNPFIARNLALNILAIGQQMKWLDHDNEITPTTPKE